MSIQSVEGAAGEFRRLTEEANDSRDRLVSAMGDAARAGVPVAAIARAAGVSRQTAIKWLRTSL